MEQAALFFPTVNVSVPTSLNIQSLLRTSWSKSFCLFSQFHLSVHSQQSAPTCCAMLKLNHMDPIGKVNLEICHRDGTMQSVCPTSQTATKSEPAAIVVASCMSLSHPTNPDGKALKWHLVTSVSIKKWGQGRQEIAPDDSWWEMWGLDVTPGNVTQTSEITLGNSR